MEEPAAKLGAECILVWLLECDGSVSCSRRMRAGEVMPMDMVPAGRTTSVMDSEPVFGERLSTEAADTLGAVEPIRARAKRLTDRGVSSSLESAEGASGRLFDRADAAGRV